MTGNPDHFANFGLDTIPGGAGGKAWTGDYVFNTGNLKLDLLHNFFLESGARMARSGSTNRPRTRWPARWSGT
jgi:Mn-containing catalase